MPTSCAASRLCEVASIALPRRVRPKNHDSAATMTTRHAQHPQALRQDRRAARARSARSPESGGSACRPLSQTSCATPRRKIEAPMVMMISVTTSARRAPARSRTSRAASPTTAATATAAGDRHGQRQPRPSERDRAHAADHDELALGEVDDAARVEDDREAERHQRVDRPRP